MSLIQSPTIKNKKINNLKKNNIGKVNHINNIGIKKKEEKNYLSSFSIKLNKENINKDKVKNNKNLKTIVNSNMNNNIK